MSSQFVFNYKNNVFMMPAASFSDNLYYCNTNLLLFQSILTKNSSGNYHIRGTWLKGISTDTMIPADFIFRSYILL